MLNEEGLLAAGGGGACICAALHDGLVLPSLWPLLCIGLMQGV